MHAPFVSFSYTQTSISFSFINGFLLWRIKIWIFGELLVGALKTQFVIHTAVSTLQEMHFLIAFHYWLYSSLGQLVVPAMGSFN
jgi:hypothetical protein